MNIKTIKKASYVTLFITITIFLIVIIHTLLSTRHYIRKKATSTKLESLIINEHKIDFDPDKDYYEIALNNNETSLSIDAKAQSNSSKIKIYNNDDLTKHDAVYIYVTNKLGQSQKYTIGYTNKDATKYFINNIDNCKSITDDYCIKYFNLKDNDKDYYLLFSYDKLTNDGYPNTNLITVNDKLVFKKKLISGEFHNFNILDNGILFTYNNSKEANKINLFGVNIDGEILLNKTTINNNLKNLYTYNFNFKDNIISLKTRISNLSNDYICKLKNDSIFEARYTIEYKNGSFSEPLMTNKITTLEYKIIKNINC